MVASPKIIQFLQISQVPQNISTLHPPQKKFPTKQLLQKNLPPPERFSFGGKGGGVGWGCLTRNNG